MDIVTVMTVTMKCFASTYPLILIQDINVLDVDSEV